MDSALVIVRGLPGSGKSTLAKEISRACGYIHVENDLWFEGEGGYTYDAAGRDAAQRWCFLAARDALLAGGRVVVSNTFVSLEHMAAFLDLTASVTVIECSGTYGSLHNVPEEMIQRMRDDWEPFPGAIRL